MAENRRRPLFVGAYSGTGDWPSAVHSGEIPRVLSGQLLWIERVSATKAGDANIPAGKPHCSTSPATTVIFWRGGPN